jgi:hypothetical protein
LSVARNGYNWAAPPVPASWPVTSGDRAHRVLEAPSRSPPPHVGQLALSRALGDREPSLVPISFPHVRFRLSSTLPSPPSLLVVAGRLHHTPSTSVPQICTTVASSSARARLQLEAPATEAGLPSSPAASSCSRSSPSILVLWTRNDHKSTPSLLDYFTAVESSSTTELLAVIRPPQ